MLFATPYDDASDLDLDEVRSGSEPVPREYFVSLQRRDTFSPRAK